MKMEQNTLPQNSGESLDDVLPMEEVDMMTKNEEEVKSDGN